MMPLQHLQLILLCSWQYLYLTDREIWTSCPVQRGLTALNSWRERWNIKINEGKTQAIYFSGRFTAPEDIPFVNNVRYLGVTFDRRITWRLRIQLTGAKNLRTYIRPSVLKSELLNTTIKSTLYTLEYVSYDLCLSKTRYTADAYFLKQHHR
jgi:hypothetical protein